MLQPLRDPLRTFTDFVTTEASYIVYGEGGVYYVKDGRTGAIVFSSLDASEALQYAIDSADGVVVARGVAIPPDLKVTVPVVHVDGDYAIYTPQGILLSDDVLGRLVLYIKDKPVNLVDGEVFEYSNVRFVGGFVRIDRGGYLRSRGRKYSTDIPWRRDAVDVGGWYWFNHPNILYAGGYVFLGYVGLGGTAGFRSRVARVDPATGSVSMYDMYPADDDHATPALDILPDNRIVAAVSGHVGKVIRFAVSDSPLDVSSWTVSDIDLSTALEHNNVSYPAPFVLSVAGATRVFIFFRDGYAGSSKWKAIYSDDLATWSSPVTVADPAGIAPSIYVVGSRVGNRVYFAASLAHGGEEAPKKNVYFFYFDGVSYYRADGAKIADFGTALTPTVLEKVFDSDAEGYYGAWVWDVYADAEGRPIVAFAAFKKVGDVYEHYYYVARWTGYEWVVKMVADKGDLYPIDREYLYSAGIWIMRSDPTKVLVARRSRKGWRLEVRDLDGNLISVIAESSTPYEKVMRPVEDGGTVFWMSGTYWQKWGLDTYILGNTPIRTEPRVVYAINEPFVLSAWFTVEPDMDDNVRHVVVFVGKYILRLNAKKLEGGVWGTNLLTDEPLPVGEHHGMIEYADGVLKLYLNGRLVKSAWRVAAFGAGEALEIGYRTGFGTPEWWGRVSHVALIRGRVGNATKLALYNARFYGGLLVPGAGRATRGVATIAAGTTRTTVEHWLTARPARVLLTPYANIRVWVENVSDTSFDIVTDAAPAADVSVSWYAEV